MLKSNLVLVDESPVYGGHESMLMSFLESIISELVMKVNVHFIVNDKNKKLITHLKEPEFSAVIVHEVCLSSTPIKPITQFFLYNDTANIKRVFNKLKPKVVLNIQGTIEIGCTSLWLCKNLNIPVISYLPITKSSRNLGVRFGRLRDILCKNLYYPIPINIITISETNASELQRIFSISKNNVTIVHNFVENKPANDSYFFPVFSPEKKHLALIGRISNAQKQQYSYLKEWLKSDFVNDYVVHVVGDSNDQESQQLRVLCADAITKGTVVFHGWQPPQYVSQVIKKCNTLLLPSRFEGVPLVMIEAIALGCNVVGSAVDGMKEFLPKELTFEEGDWSSMFKIIERVDNHPENERLFSETQDRFRVFNKGINTHKFLTTIMKEVL